MAIGEETNTTPVRPTTGTSHDTVVPIRGNVFPTIDHNHPIYLQPIDTPGSSLISLQLTGSENYAIWSRSIRIGLLDKSKLDFVDAFFTPEQYQQIVQMLNKGSDEGSSTNSAAASTETNLMSIYSDREWIVDTGASNHMASSLQMLKAYKLVPKPDRSNVHLPTGVSKLTKELKCLVMFFPDFCIFQDIFNGQVKGIGREKHGLYMLQEKQVKTSCQDSRQQVKNNTITCSMNKASHAYMSAISDSRTCRVPTYDGKRFFVTIVYDYTRFTWIFLLHSKSNTIVVLRDFLLRLKIFSVLLLRYSEQTIANGVAKRKHRTVLEIARALRFQADIPLRFWGECVNTAVYLLNRLPSRVINFKSPFEMIYLHAPSLSHLRVFGCLCYAVVPKYMDKFASKAMPSVLLGYSSTQNGYKPYDLQNKTLLAMKQEVAALEDNKTWSIVDLPPGKTPIGCKWIFKFKYRAS
ncbi:uncharacterized protein [Nicotiana tomentosiformis]|uniref:uncharacterized protein n=1 Tax=Nicotiana tomentosiformis TaxID=4098 RepID=UPI00388C781F